jgi:hypothetical protein
MFSIKDARLDRQECVQWAIQNDDNEQLYKLAQLFKEEGEDEVADELRKLARQAEKNNWAYDEARDNNL